MRRRIEAIAVAVAEMMEANVTPPESKLPQELWEERMREQRRAWARQDLRRYRDDTKERLLDAGYRDDIWNVYGWSPKYKRWAYVGRRPVRSHRRKQMTMNRLFAGIRQRFGIPKYITLKLITQVDDELRQRRGELFVSPTRFGGRVIPGSIVS